MQTHLHREYAQTVMGQEAESVLRSCVHCGFCTATCPTYQLLGDELDGPRGRIYLIKQVLEGQAATRKTLSHLDRCLTCRSCETTCPSGVRYGRLLDIGRHIVEGQVKRPLAERIERKLLLTFLPRPGLFKPLLALGHTFKSVLPPGLKTKLPVKQQAGVTPKNDHPRKMLIIDGCVQSAVTPATNAAAARVLDKLGIQLIREKNAACCGAVAHHFSAEEMSLQQMRSNIDAWWPAVEQGVEAIISTASGCGVVIKDYGRLLAHDGAYAEKALRISKLVADISEVLAREALAELGTVARGRKVAFHSPCTLQHGQKIVGSVEKVLTSVGYRLTSVKDSHLCCGSAGTYSLLQPELSQQLLDAKLDSLQAQSPDLIATANIGCQMHMASKAGVPVKHWIELLDPQSM